VQKHESFAGVQEIDDTVPVFTMTYPEFPELFLEMFGIWHPKIDPEFLKHI